MGFVLLASLLISCSASHKAKQAFPATTVHRVGSTTTIDTRNHQVFTVRSSNLLSTGAPTQFPKASERRAIGIVKHYLEAAMWAPLHDHRLGTGYKALFTSVAGKHLVATPADQAVVNDLNSKLGATDLVASIRLNGLADQQGQVVTIAARFLAQARNGAALTVRSGELLLVPFAGTWFIAGYELTVTRTANNQAHPTTSTANSFGKVSP